MADGAPAVASFEIEEPPGGGAPQQESEVPGYEIPYADPITEQIDLYRRSWEDYMRLRIRLTNRGTDPETGEPRSPALLEQAEIAETSEASLRRKLERLIREHPMADWLADAKTQGARVATILTTIRHPHRFPSQKCSEGCHLLPEFEAGDPCPCLTTPAKGGDPEPCSGTIEAPRPGTGCRALWHMLGLYPVQDDKGRERLATYRRGVQGSHNREAKTAILMPLGIAQQFYTQKSRYADVYYKEKARLAERDPEKAPGWLDTTARVIAAKAWSGDLLVEWKKRVPLGAGNASEVDSCRGSRAVA